MQKYIYETVYLNGLFSWETCCENSNAVQNRYVNGVTNIYRIAKNAINGLSGKPDEQPKYLCREKKKNLKNRKSKKSFIKKSINHIMLMP